MIEVEAKVKISEPRDYRIIARRIGKFKGHEKKVDDYYTLESVKSYPRKSLRVRKRNGKYEINFKKSLSFRQGIHSKKEIEFKLSDSKDFLQLIDDFGFKKWLRKEKESEIYEINKNFHIEINYVKNLGWFVEVEYLSDIQHVHKARECVIELMRVLGFSRKDFVDEGYTRLLWNKKNR